MAMGRRMFGRDFTEGAIRSVRETRRPIAQVAGELGLNESTLRRRVNLDRRARQGEGPLSDSERDAALAMECDVLKRSAVRWVKGAMQQ